MSMTERNLTCIGCPMGCLVNVVLHDDGSFAVSGNACPNGERYAKSELTAPVRQITSTVRVKSGELAVVPVKTAAPVPKDSIFRCVTAMKELSVTAPVKIGDVVAEDIAGTGVAVIVTKDVAAVG